VPALIRVCRKFAEDWVGQNSETRAKAEIRFTLKGHNHLVAYGKA